MSIADTLKDHIVMVVLGSIVAGYTAGWASYKAVLEAQNQEPILKERKSELEGKEKELASIKASPATALTAPAAKQVDLVAIFNMGKSIANAQSSAKSAPKSAQDSLNGAIQAAERIYVLQENTKATMYKYAGGFPNEDQLSTVVNLLESDLTVKPR